MHIRLDDTDSELFPAHAGVILRAVGMETGLLSFPRPRGGDPQLRPHMCGHCWLFPAHAGVIPSKSARAYKRVTFPRPRGGDPTHRARSKRLPNFSPPTRG